MYRIATTLLLSSLAWLAQAEPLTIEVLSAVTKDQKIPDADVLLQKNGEQSVIGRTNAQGQVTLNTHFADNADSLLIIKRDGYSNLVAKCPCNGMTYAISPVMQNLDGMRVVLSWGQTPYDLDSHTVYPGNHVYFEDKEGTDANLDVDDTNSYGPETITLQKKHFGETYVYAVHDYSHINSPLSHALSDSQAKVFVYIGQSLVRTYYVPTNQPGNLWTVFRVNGSGELQDINRLSGIPNSANDQVSDLLSTYLNGDSALAVSTTSPQAQQDAKALNRRGEELYHAGRLDQAIDLFRQAIEHDSGFGQAYSNLGLAYQKSNRTAEAIWANRKAIALASGATASTVRASSYYNIARIYEAAGQSEDALRQYQLAREQKANPVYDNAIQRLTNRH